MSKASDLDDAPAHVKLAVDLIMLLEQNEIAPDLVLDALAIVRDDCQRKLEGLQCSQGQKHLPRRHGDTEEEKEK